jgi:Zn-dependent protease with chaperone function
MEHAAAYFDGLTAASRPASARITKKGVEIILGEDATRFWNAPDLELKSPGPTEIRLGWKKSPDAQLVLPMSAADALRAAMPGLLSGVADRRRMTILISALLAASAAVAAAVFIGVPMAAKPLADATPRAYEEQFGENVAAQIGLIWPKCEGSARAAEILQPTVDRFAAAAQSPFPVRLSIVDEEAPNAFALPGGRVMATSGLLRAVGDDQEAFLAVLAHEVGHVQARDGMQAFYRNAGIGLVLEVVTGGSGVAQQAVLLAGQLTQLRYSRRQESAADVAARDILLAEGLDPAALARAFDAIEKGVADLAKNDEEAGPARRESAVEKSVSTWLSSHPETEKRKTAARAAAKRALPPPLSKEQWAEVRAACDGASDE